MGVPSYAIPSRIALSNDERTAYRALANTLVQTALKDFASFCVDNPSRRVSPMDWKLVKSQDGVSVYKERHPPTTRKDAPFVPRLLTVDGRFERVEANISVPMMLATGTMHGSVDDAIHGAFVDGPEAHATRGYYIHDRSSDFRVLAHIDGPNDADPYRFCGLAWTEMGSAGVPFVMRRDLLTLIVSGMVTLPDTNERVGYYIIHSISHPDLPQLTEHKLLRAKCSFSYLFSQQYQHGGIGGVGSQVETYQKGFFAPLGEVPERGVVSSVMRTLINPGRLVEAGNSRKLAFLMHHAPPGRSGRTKSRAGSRDDTTYTSDDADDSDGDDSCAGGCARRRSDSFFSSSGGSAFSSSGGPLRKFTHQSQGTCVICKLKVCASCKVVKKLVVEANGYEIEVKSLVVCLVCVNKVKMLSAPMLARQELAEKRGLTGLMSPSPPPPPPQNAQLSPDPGTNSLRSPPLEKPQAARKTSGAGVDALSSRTGKDEGYAARLRMAIGKPRVARKTSWSPSTTSSMTGYFSDAGPPSTGRSMSIDKSRMARKTSWVGSEASSNHSTPRRDDGTAVRTRSSPNDKPHAERKTSWVGIEATKGSFSSDEGSTKKMRAPPPPPPSRRSPPPPTFVNSPLESVSKIISIGSTQRKQASPPPRQPMNRTINPNTNIATVNSVQTERRVASPTGGIYLFPKQDKQPRKRRDERTAIEDITLNGILL